MTYPHRLIPRQISAFVVATPCLVLQAATSTLAQSTERAAVRTTPHFAFYSDRLTNLNDALITGGKARRQGEAELFHAGPEASCFRALPSAERAAWNRAVDYYAEVISPSGGFDREQTLLRSDLIGLRTRAMKRAENRRFVEITRHIRAAAAPAYDACRWSTQDAQNRRWIDQVLPLLGAHEKAIAARLERLYQKAWDGLAIRVDVVETPTDSILTTSGGHILISSANKGNQGAAALEMVFHEASHLLAATWRADPLPDALQQAASRLDLPLPDGLWHVVLFYMTGETVRRVLAEAGQPDYTPYVYAQGLFERGGSGSWRRYRRPIEDTWRAYLDGERTLSEAAADLIRTLGEADRDRR